MKRRFCTIKDVNRGIKASRGTIDNGESFEINTIRMCNSNNTPLISYLVKKNKISEFL